MKIQRPMYSNCFFGAIYLIFRGCIRHIVVLDSISRKVPFHFIGLNKNKQVVHFNHVLEPRFNTIAPWWFLGRFEGVSRRIQKQMLEKSGRKIIFYLGPSFIALPVFLFVWIILCVPWTIFWALYTWYWNFYWLFHGIKKGIKKWLIF